MQMFDDYDEQQGKKIKLAAAAAARAIAKRNGGSQDAAARGTKTGDCNLYCRHLALVVACVHLSNASALHAAPYN